MAPNNGPRRTQQLEVKDLAASQSGYSQDDAMRLVDEFERGARFARFVARNVDENQYRQLIETRHALLNQLETGLYAGPPYQVSQIDIDSIASLSHWYHQFKSGECDAFVVARRNGEGFRQLLRVYGTTTVLTCGLHPNDNCECSHVTLVRSYNSF
jgi:hypothetical protein